MWRNGKRWRRRRKDKAREAGVSEAKPRARRSKGRQRHGGAGESPSSSQFCALLYWKRVKVGDTQLLAAGSLPSWLADLRGDTQLGLPSEPSLPQDPRAVRQGSIHPDVTHLLKAQSFPAFTTGFSQPSLAGLDRIQLGHTPQRFSGCTGGVTPTSLCTP